MIWVSRTAVSTGRPQPLGDDGGDPVFGEVARALAGTLHQGPQLVVGEVPAGRLQSPRCRPGSSAGRVTPRGRAPDGRQDLPAQRPDSSGIHRAPALPGWSTLAWRRPRGQTRSGLRYLALKDSRTAIALNPLLSAEYARVVDGQRKRALTNQMVARQVPENTRGAAGAAPPLLITRSQVRVLPGEPKISWPTKAIASETGIRVVLHPRNEKDRESSLTVLTAVHRE
jgi:hypothetical protein